MNAGDVREVVKEKYRQAALRVKGGGSKLLRSYGGERTEL
jgi:hypothetical protein